MEELEILDVLGLAPQMRSDYHQSFLWGILPAI